jgi:hypothetical protein
MEIVLKNGIILRDNMNIKCGISVQNQNTKYLTLEYSSENGFYLKTKGVYLTKQNILEYTKEFELMVSILFESENKLK